MKIGLFMLNQAGHGGAEKHTAELASRLADQGHDVLLACHSQVLAAMQGMVDIRAPIYDLDQAFPSGSESFATWRQFLVGQQFQAVVLAKGHISQGSLAFHRAAATCRRFITIEHSPAQAPPPAAWRLAGGRPQLGLWRYRKILPFWWKARYPHRIVFVCHANRTYFQQHFHYPKRKCLTIHNGVDLERFQPDADARCRLLGELELPAQVFLFGLVGRLTQQKNQQLALQALARLVKSAEPGVETPGPGVMGDGVLETPGPGVMGDGVLETPGLGRKSAERGAWRLEQRRTKNEEQRAKRGNVECRMPNVECRSKEKSDGGLEPSNPDPAPHQPSTNHQAPERRAPRVALAFFGRGEDEAMLKQLTADLGLQGQVVFAGNRSDIEKVYPGLDCLLMSSACEGLPLTLLESFACGCPAVATAVDGVPEIISMPQFGWLATPRGATDLATKMGQAMADTLTHRQAMGKACRQRIVDHFDATTQYGKLIQLIEEGG